MTPLITLALILLFNNSVAKAGWNDYKEVKGDHPDRVLLMGMFGPSVKLHKWMAHGGLKSSRDGNQDSSGAAHASIIFSITDPRRTAYACAARKCSVAKAGNAEILGVTHFFQADSADKDGKLTMKQVKAHYESSGPTQPSWIPPLGGSTSKDLLAAMNTKHGIRVVREQRARALGEYNVTVSALQTTVANTYNFEVDIGQTALNRSITDTIVNYFGCWTDSQIEMDGNVSAYFDDPTRERKDAKVRALLDDLGKKWMKVAQKGGAQPMKLHKVWRVAGDTNGDILVVAVCATVDGIGANGYDNIVSYTVVEIRIHSGYDAVARPQEFTVFPNPPMDAAGASVKLAQLIWAPNTICQDSQLKLTTSATTTHQIEGVAQ